MARLEILEYPDERLRQTAAPVIEFDPSIATLADDLLETMYACRAIGLCAPQADVHKQLLVLDVSADQSSPEVYVNPEILKSAAPGFVEESCLSLPGITVNVLRATRVRVAACDATGKRFERDLEGMSAVCLQHEMDHFDGKLLVDRASIFRRWRIRSVLRARAASRA